MSLKPKLFLTLITLVSIGIACGASAQRGTTNTSSRSTRGQMNDMQEDGMQRNMRGTQPTQATGRSGRGASKATTGRSGRTSGTAAPARSGRGMGTAKTSGRSGRGASKATTGRSGRTMGAKATGRSGRGMGTAKTSGRSGRGASKATTGRSGRTSGTAAPARSGRGMGTAKTSGRSGRGASKATTGRSGRAMGTKATGRSGRTGGGASVTGPVQGTAGSGAQTMNLLAPTGMGVNYYDEKEGFGSASLLRNKEEAKQRAQAEKTIADTANCEQRYSACMDQFCTTDNDEMGQCACSSSYKDIKNREDALTKILAEINQINQQKSALKLGGQFQAYTDETQSELALDGIGQATDEDDDDDMPELITSLDDFAEFDLDGGNVGKAKEGFALYKSAHKACSQYLRACPDTAEMAKQAYENKISKSCNAVSQTIAKKEMAAKMQRQSTYNSYQREKMKIEAKKNKLNASQCTSQLYTCMQKEEACGTGFSKCYDPVVLNTYKMFCSETLDQCQDVADEVWENFVQIASGRAQLDTSQCMTQLRGCFQDACGENFVNCIQLPDDGSFSREEADSYFTVDLYRPQCETIINSCKGDANSNYERFMGMMKNELKLSSMGAEALCTRAGNKWIRDFGRCETKQEAETRKQAACSQKGFAWNRKAKRCNTLSEEKTACRANDSGEWAMDNPDYPVGYCRTKSEREMDRFTRLREGCEGTADRPTGKFYVEETQQCLDKGDIAQKACADVSGYWERDKDSGQFRCFSKEEKEMVKKGLEAQTDLMKAKKEAENACKDSDGFWELDDDGNGQCLSLQEANAKHNCKSGENWNGTECLGQAACNRIGGSWDATTSVCSTEQSCADQQGYWIDLGSEKKCFTEEDATAACSKFSGSFSNGVCSGTATVRARKKPKALKRGKKDVKQISWNTSSGLVCSDAGSKYWDTSCRTSWGRDYSKGSHTISLSTLLKSWYESK